MNCMNPLTGQWLLSGLPSNWKSVPFELNAADGEITGNTAIIVNGETRAFIIKGSYDGSRLEIDFIEYLTNSDMPLFRFMGDCAGDNLFDGTLLGEGELQGEAKITIKT